MAFSTSDLRIIVCDDEYLLADHMAEQLSELGAKVVAIACSLTDLDGIITDHPDANAAVLDVELLDGEVYSIVPVLEQRGMAIAFCSAHLISDRPAQFSHIGWFDKLAPIEDIASALCSAQGARSDHHTL